MQKKDREEGGSAGPDQGDGGVVGAGRGRGDGGVVGAARATTTCSGQARAAWSGRALSEIPTGPAEWS